jgi:spermidine/putrescine transport system permease protein
LESWREQPVVFWTFLLPGGLWLLAFFIAPLALIWLFSFGERAGPVDVVITGTLENYLAVFDPLYLGLFWKSFWIAALATALVLIVGFPVALAVSFAPARIKPLLLLLVILPFWTNLLIRTYAMTAMLRTRGYVNFGLEALWDTLAAALGALGLALLPPFQPLPLLYNNTAVVVGIVYVYLPFMVLPLYATLERLDRTFLEASLDLGAPPRADRGGPARCRSAHRRRAWRAGEGPDRRSASPVPGAPAPRPGLRLPAAHPHADGPGPRRGLD